MQIQDDIYTTTRNVYITQLTKTYNNRDAAHQPPNIAFTCYCSPNFVYLNGPIMTLEIYYFGRILTMQIFVYCKNIYFTFSFLA